MTTGSMLFAAMCFGGGMLLAGQKQATGAGAPVTAQVRAMCFVLVDSEGRDRASLRSDEHRGKSGGPQIVFEMLSEKGETTLEMKSGPEGSSIELGNEGQGLLRLSTGTEWGLDNGALIDMCSTHGQRVRLRAERATGGLTIWRGETVMVDGKPADSVEPIFQMPK